MFPEPSVNWFVVAFNVSDANVGEDVVAIGCGVESIIPPGVEVTITSFAVPRIWAATGAAPEEPIKIWPLVKLASGIIAVPVGFVASIALPLPSDEEPVPP